VELVKYAEWQEQKKGGCTYNGNEIIYFQSGAALPR